MRLDRLLAALPGAQGAGVSEEIQGSIEISHITADSRRVGPGTLFVAYRGVEADGHAFIDQALASGAIAIVAEKGMDELVGDPVHSRLLPSDLSTPFPYIVVPNGREALAHLSAAWHDYPARRLTMIGVTGTDGKTTVANLIHSIFISAGLKASLISTVSAMIGDEVYDTGLHTTTPDAPDVQTLLARMVAAGSEVAVLETTSHGLAQHRVTACDFDVAVVTNVTHEHLDLHGTLDAYLAAKALLFERLVVGHRKEGVPKVSVLNRDDSSFERLRAIPADVHLTYGLGEAADVRVVAVDYNPDGTRFTIALRPSEAYPDLSALELETALVGEYNVYNCLAAVAVGLSQSVDQEAIRAGISRMKGVVGRMERLDEGQDFLAIVDFAHTPRALEAALTTARHLAEKRVIVVFGSAGLRDVRKRAWMGRIASRLADRVVITAEDPRTESLDAIMAEVARGCEAEGGRQGTDYWRIGDRATAIAFAVRMAQPGDVVIVTGKGHEQSMCFGTIEYPWSDHAALRAALRGEPLPKQFRLPESEHSTRGVVNAR